MSKTIPPTVGLVWGLSTVSNAHAAARRVMYSGSDSKGGQRPDRFGGIHSWMC